VQPGITAIVDGDHAAAGRYCWACLRDTLNRVTTTIDATRHDEDVNAAG
jgi:hypothetical protein